MALTLEEMLELANARQWAADGTAKRIRIAAGLSQPEMADLAECDYTSISNWEGGRRAPQRSAGLGYARLLILLGSRTGIANYIPPHRCSDHDCPRWAVDGSLSCWVHSHRTWVRVSDKCPKCKKSAGWGTSHLGEGFCRYHDSATS